MSISVSLDKFRANLKTMCDQVCEEHEPVLVTRRNGEDVVVMSEEDYASLMETAYLMRSPTNAKRLLEALGRNREEQTTFENIDELSHAVGH